MALRIVALTTDPSLSVAMTMIRGADVLETDNIFTAARLAETVDIVVVGLGATVLGHAALVDLREQGVTAPILVVGDRAPENDDWLDAPLLVPPFTVEDIEDAALAAIDARKPTHAVDQSVAAAAGDIAEPRAQVAAPPAEDLVVQKLEEPTAVPASAEPDLRPAPRRPPEPPAPAPPPPPAPPPVAPEPEPVRERAYEPPAVQEPAPLPQPPPAKRPPGAPRRLFRRPSQPKPVPQASSSIDDQIKRALEALADVHGLLDQIPALTDLGVLADALLSEVLERAHPELAGVLLRSGDLLTVRAAAGFTNQEMSMKVPMSQPLVVQLLTSHDAVYIAPVDLARGLLGGIPGARTEAMLAAPITHGSDLFGMIVAGGSAFEHPALIAIDDIAREAAAGIAVALSVERLRER